MLQLFRAAILFAQQTNQKGYVQQLQEAAQRLDEGKFIAVVCGESNVGKSSLLNALLEEWQDPFFPEGIFTRTGLVSAISYGPTEKITVLYNEPDSHNVKEVIISRTDIRNYVTEQDNSDNIRQANLVVIQTPKAQLKQGLVLVDTPMLGGLNAQYTAIVNDLIPKTDVVLFVSDALEPLSQIELNFIKERVLPYGKHVIFVLTKIDMIGDEHYRRVMESNRQTLAAILGRRTDEITIIPISSALKHEYLISHNPADLEESNFPLLETTLRQLLDAYWRATIANALVTLTQILSAIHHTLQIEIDALREQEQLQLSLKETRSSLRRIEKRKDRSLALLREGLENIRLRTHEYLYQLNEEITDQKFLREALARFILSETANLLDSILDETDLKLSETDVMLGGAGAAAVAALGTVIIPGVIGGVIGAVTGSLFETPRVRISKLEKMSTTALTSFEQTIGDRILSLFEQEKQSQEQVLSILKEKPKFTNTEVTARIALLEDSLQQLEHISGGSKD